MGIAITTNGKINDLLNSGRLDQSVVEAFQKAEQRHTRARTAYERRREELNLARERVNTARERLNDISLLHPIRRIRARRALNRARANARLSESQYNLSRIEYRDSLFELRSVRNYIRESHRSSNAFDRNKNMIKYRINEAMRLGIVIPPVIKAALEAELNKNPGVISIGENGRSHLQSINMEPYNQLISLINAKQIEIAKGIAKGAVDVVKKLAEGAANTAKEIMNDDKEQSL